MPLSNRTPALPAATTVLNLALGVSAEAAGDPNKAPTTDRATSEKPKNAQPQAVDMFVKLGDIEGESTEAKTKKLKPTEKAPTAKKGSSQ